MKNYQPTFCLGFYQPEGENTGCHIVDDMGDLVVPNTQGYWLVLCAGEDMYTEIWQVLNHLYYKDIPL